MTEIESVPVKHDIKKDHSKYIHTTVVEYPHSTVNNMRKSWREAIEEYTEWLETFDDKYNSALELGKQRIKDENEQIQKELTEFAELSKEEQIVKLMEEKKKFIEKQEQFIKGIDKRLEEFEKNVFTELGKQKQKVLTDAKQKKDALKLWADK